MSINAQMPLQNIGFVVTTLQKILATTQHSMFVGMKTFKISLAATTLKLVTPGTKKIAGTQYSGNGRVVALPMKMECATTLVSMIVGTKITMLGTAVLSR